MTIVTDIETVITDLECENKNASEYKNALSILKNEKLITSGTFSNVIVDLELCMMFDESKKEEYSSEILKLKNASI